MTKQKTKTPAANVRVPQTDEEAAAFVTDIGRAATEIDRLTANLQDDIAVLKANAAAEVADPLRRRNELVLGLKMYCEANRARLTKNFSTKTITFPTGKVSWRSRKAAVTIKGKAADVIERIKALALSQFIRTKEEVDKEAMLKQAELASTISGVSIASAGEDFTVGDEAGAELADMADASEAA
ncbi:MAG: host-nuclease inhibitor Gam family protein [Pseudolabrys sp.]